jgi:mRNA-degrading endonuclease RelE of RelBE toxin-antitoxin system
MGYRILFTPEAADQVGDLRAHDRRRLLDAIERQLAHQPGVPTRNRGRLRPNAVAAFRLRIGNLRAYDDVDLAAGTVLVKAVGIKRRSRVFIGGAEIEL